MVNIIITFLCILGIIIVIELGIGIILLAFSGILELLDVTFDLDLRKKIQEKVKGE